MAMNIVVNNLWAIIFSEVQKEDCMRSEISDKSTRLYPLEDICNLKIKINSWLIAATYVHET